MGEILKDVMPEDFIKFGLIPEFIGRVPVVVTLDALDENALISILKEPKNSLTKQYHRLFELDGVELDLKMMHLNWSQRNLWNVRQEPEVCVRSWKVH